MEEEKVELEDTKHKEKEVANNKTVEEFYKAIDKTVTQFAQDFMGMMPRHEQVAINNVLIINHILAVKEMAKFLVNNYIAAVEYAKEKEAEKEDK